MTYINKYSWKSFLGPQAKNIMEDNGFFIWETQKKRQLVKDRPLQVSDLDFLETLRPFNYFYFSIEEIKILKSKFEVSKTLDSDIIIPIKSLDFVGRKYHGIRHALNKAAHYNLTASETLSDLGDIKTMLSRWSDTSGEKYFQDRSGKNIHFFYHNFHRNCLNLFLYDQKKLVAFASLSPVIDQQSSYIIGKTLCIDYPGLSEYADVLIYQKAQALGAESINLGGGGKNLKKYKMKFPNAYESVSYDGKVL